MNKDITLNSALGVMSYVLILGVSPICTDSQNNFTPENHNLGVVNYQSFDISTTSVKLQTSMDSRVDSEVLHDFISSMLKEMKPLDDNLAEFVSENFWSLI